MRDSFDQKLKLQRESTNKDLKDLLDRHARDQESRLLGQLRLSYQSELQEQLETKLVEYQEKLIKYTESKCEDNDLKIKNMVANAIRDESLSEKLKLKQSLDLMERNLKADLKADSSNFFITQAELNKVGFLFFKCLVLHNFT
jgi:hypothetical protein